MIMAFMANTYSEQYSSPRKRESLMDLAISRNLFLERQR